MSPERVTQSARSTLNRSNASNTKVACGFYQTLPRRLAGDAGLLPREDRDGRTAGTAARAVLSSAARMRGAGAELARISWTADRAGCAAGAVLSGFLAACGLPSGGLLADGGQPPPFDGGLPSTQDVHAGGADDAERGGDAIVGTNGVDSGGDDGGIAADAGALDVAALDVAAPDVAAVDAVPLEGAAAEAAAAESGPAVACPVPDSSGGALPFVIDADGVFVPSGYEGDAVGAPVSVIDMPQATGDPSCSGIRSSPSAVGSCHVVTYTPLVGGAGWAGVVWQHPANNWGTLPGYSIPAGATRVTFSARGITGAEVVTFVVGGTGYRMARTQAAPCADPLSATVKVTLSAAWKTYTIEFGDVTYASGVLAAFGFKVATSDQPPGRAATTFFVDDIQWQE